MQQPMYLLYMNKKNTSANSGFGVRVKELRKRKKIEKRPEVRDVDIRLLDNSNTYKISNTYKTSNT